MNEAGPACDVGSVRDKIEAGFVCQCRSEWMRRHNRVGGKGGRERETVDVMGFVASTDGHM
jgi:hypothetical protein